MSSGEKLINVFPFAFKGRKIRSDYYNFSDDSDIDLNN